MELKLDTSTVPFSLEHTLDCGQLFRWQKRDDWWYGVVSDSVVKIKQSSEGLVFEVFPETKNQGFIKKERNC